MDFFVTFVVVPGSVFLHCDKLSGWLCMQREGQACRPVLQHLPLWQGDFSKTQLQNSFLRVILKVMSKAGLEIRNWNGRHEVETVGAQNPVTHWDHKQGRGLFVWKNL